MPRVQIPDWRFEPEQVWIACQSIIESDGPKELFVHFRADEQNYYSFVPDEFIDRSNNGMAGAIIADVDGGVLVDIPRETFTSGVRIFVRDSEREALLSPRRSSSL